MAKTDCKECNKYTKEVDVDFLKRMSDLLVDLNSWTGMYALSTKFPTEVDKIKRTLEKSQETMDKIWNIINFDER